MDCSVALERINPIICIQGTQYSTLLFKTIDNCIKLVKTGLNYSFQSNTSSGYNLIFFLMPLNEDPGNDLNFSRVS
jgi:hypothetical protein